MLYKLWMTVNKEFCLLKRDFGGLLILFVMPLFLVITVTLIQDSAYQNISNKKIPILIVDLDQSSISATILEEISASGSFDILTELKGELLDEERVKEAVFKGQYQMGIIIPQYLSRDLNLKIDENVNRVLEAFSFGDSVATRENSVQAKEIRLYFDPAVQISFKEGIKGAIDKMIAQIENKSIYQAFSNQLSDEEDDALFEQENFIRFNEIKPSSRVDVEESLPNSVQHNVPAWTLFAIFFIMVPLSINIIKEKNQGTKIRMLTIPTPSYLLLMGKIIVYLVICLLQFYLISGVGIYLFPQIGLPKLDVEGCFWALTLISLFAGLSAISLGVLLGVVAKTQEQSAPFGATFTVILAAVGGVWIPTFAMPLTAQYISRLSPMNWALEGYYTILLRNGSIYEILPNIAVLLLFSMIIIAIAILYDKKERYL